MRGHLSLTVFCLLLASAVSAQMTTEQMLRKKPARNADLEGIVLTYQADFLAGLPGGVVKYREGRSGGITFSVFANQRLGKESRWSVAEGLGISYRNYFSNIQDWTVSGLVYPDSPAIKNKHAITTIDLPLELRYTTRERGNLKAFKFVVGFNFAYVINYRHKRVLGRLVSINSGDASNLALVDWRPALTARLGYHRMAISGYYGLTELFGNGAAYRGVKPWSLGLSITL